MTDKPEPLTTTDAIKRAYEMLSTTHNTGIQQLDAGDALLDVLRGLARGGIATVTAVKAVADDLTQLRRDVDALTAPAAEPDGPRVRYQSETRNLAYEARGVYAARRAAGVPFVDWEQLSEPVQQAWLASTAHVMKRTRGMFGLDTPAPATPAPAAEPATIREYRTVAPAEPLSDVQAERDRVYDWLGRWQPWAHDLMRASGACPPNVLPDDTQAREPRGSSLDRCRECHEQYCDGYDSDNEPCHVACVRDATPYRRSRAPVPLEPAPPPVAPADICEPCWYCGDACGGLCGAVVRAPAPAAPPPVAHARPDDICEPCGHTYAEHTGQAYVCHAVVDGERCTGCLSFGEPSPVAPAEDRTKPPQGYSVWSSGSSWGWHASTGPIHGFATKIEAIAACWAHATARPQAPSAEPPEMIADAHSSRAAKDPE